MQQLQEDFWCYSSSGIYAESNKENKARYPILGIHWDNNIATYKSFCEKPFVYIDIKEKCFPHGYDAIDGTDWSIWKKKQMMAT